MQLKWWTLKHMAHVIEIPVINIQCNYNRHKGKVVPVQVMMANKGHRGTAPVIVDLALDGGGLSASCPTASLDIFGAKSFYPYLELNPGSSISKPIHYTENTILAPTITEYFKIY